MSLASFAFSAAKPLWLCINISLHPHHRGLTPVTCKIARGSKARLGIAIAPSTKAALTFLGISMLKHCDLVSASTL